MEKSWGCLFAEISSSFLNLSPDGPRGYGVRWVFYGQLLNLGSGIKVINIPTFGHSGRRRKEEIRDPGVPGNDGSSFSYSSSYKSFHPGLSWSINHTFQFLSHILIVKFKVKKFNFNCL